MSEVQYPWVSKKVTRYYWNRKGYATKTHAARAIAKKEAVVWALTVVRPLFGEQFTNTIISGFSRDTRLGPAGIFIGLVFGNIGTNGDHLFAGNSYAWGLKSPWMHWLETRTRLLLSGDPLLIEREARDEDNPFGESWSISPQNIRRGFEMGLPFPPLVVPGEVMKTRAQVVGCLRDIIEAHLEAAEQWHGLSDYEIHCIKSPIDFIETLLEVAQYEPTAGGNDIEW